MGRRGAIGPERLGELFAEHAPALTLYARQWGVAAEDLVQDAFIRLARQRPEPDPVAPWLFRVVRNAAVSAARSARRRRNREERVAAPEVWFSAVDDEIDARLAREALAGLPLETREVIVARLWGGLTFEAVAQVAGCSLATAYRRYQTGLAELRTRLEGGSWASTSTRQTQMTP